MHIGATWPWHAALVHFYFKLHNSALKNAFGIKQKMLRTSLNIAVDISNRFGVVRQVFEIMFFHLGA